MKELMNNHILLLYIQFNQTNFQANAIFIKIDRQTFNNLLYKLSLTLLRFCLAKLTYKLADLTKLNDKLAGS